MIDNLPSLSILALPVVGLAIATEWWAVSTGRARGRYDARHALTSVCMGIGNVAINSATALLSLWVLKSICDLHIWDMPDTWLFFPVVMLIYDFFYYWKHRLGHMTRAMWAEHVTHHSSPDYNLATALRQPWTGPLTGLVFSGIPMVLIGFSPAWIVLASAFHLAYQFWIHTEAIGRLPGWYELIFNTPSHHRVHHATNPRYLDRNFGGTLIIWDRLFGTFEAERAEERPHYGIFKPLNSTNPIKVAFHEAAALLRDCAGDGFRPRTWARRAVNAPGWSPDGNHMRSVDVRAHWQRAQRDRPQARRD
ncbi:sterol desaturase family protein [Henriciella marina]|uniref:sterol desaturase family protein n=1 Tax=Henriciella marina TaxID=453851 RepID=UPI0003758CF7|nr:sterol desaturase family protein [Henriciella marina]